jgi:predicted transcriptional regulator
MTRPHLRVYDDLMFASGIPHREWRVLQLLLWYRNHVDGRCNPSQARLANDAGIAAVSVRRALAWLEEAGLVERKRAGRGSNWYFINEARLVEYARSKGPSQPRTSERSDRAHPSGEERAHPTHEPEEGNQVKEPKNPPGDAPLAGVEWPEPPAPVKPVDREDAGALVAVYCEGYRSTHAGRDPDPAVIKRVSGSCGQIAKTRTDSESWHDAKMAAWRAGERGTQDVVRAFTDRPPRESVGNVEAFLGLLAEPDVPSVAFPYDPPRRELE